jgi:tetratricopeptide (TPR) repeat protein
MDFYLRRGWIFLSLFLISLTPACLSSKKLTVGATAILLEGVAKSSYRQPDLKLLREGMPAYLMLLDGMIETWPDNEQLLITAAQTYSSFASLFVEDRDKEYAKILFGRGRDYALKSLEERGLKEPFQSSFEEFEKGLKTLGKKDVLYLFWGATCWANWIRMNLDSIEALAELPKVQLMMQRVLELDEGYYYGGAHLFMGIWLASRPKMAGGDLKKAQEHFLKAIDLGKGKFLMAYVYYANHYARQVLDKDLFISTLQKVLETPADASPDLTLLNTIAQREAKKLLDHMEEYFE